MINPGSCGQPRDHNQASYAILDTENGKVDFKRCDYDVDSMIKEAIRRGEGNSYHIDVLRRKGITDGK